MKEAETEHFFGIDIGTSTVRVVVGMHDPHNSGHISVIGHGSAKNLGMKKGVITHIDETVEAIAHAVDEASRVSGVKIRQATVNINGSHINGLNSTGVIAISNSDREISEDDRFRAEEAAAILQLPPNQEILQVFAKNYRVDGQDNIKDPIGMHGVRLEVDTHIVSAASANIKSLETVLKKCNININHLTVSSLAAAEASLTRQHKDAGTLLLDIGAGTTNMVVVEDGEVQHVDVIPVGGINITNDLAIGLRTDLDIAEVVKTEFASLIPGRHRDVSVTLDKVVHKFNTYDIQMVTEARIGELFDLVQKKLKAIGKAGKLPGGVVIVGGTANMPGIDSFAKERLELAARIGQLQPLKGLIDIIDNPEYATAIGLMELDMLLAPEGGDMKGTPNEGALGLIEGLVNRFRGIGRSKKRH